jgi:hypothetical protein
MSPKGENKKNKFERQQNLFNHQDFAAPQIYPFCSTFGDTQN